MGQWASWCYGFSSEVVSVPLLGVFKQGPVAIVQLDRKDSSQVGGAGLGGLWGVCNYQDHNPLSLEFSALDRRGSQCFRSQDEELRLRSRHFCARVSGPSPFFYLFWMPRFRAGHPCVLLGGSTVILGSGKGGLI